MSIQRFDRRLRYLIFLSVFLLWGVPSVFSGDLDPDLESVGTPKRSRLKDDGVGHIFTPGHSTRAPIFSMSPASKDLSFVIYLIYDSVHPLGLDKVDFESKRMTGVEIHEKFTHLKGIIDSLKESGELSTFHRYVGLVSQNESRRVAASRFLEHVRDCNSLDQKSEKRLYQGLKRNAKIGRQTRMTVLAYHIDPSQIKGIEAFLIKLFDGVGDLGWNSTVGSVSQMKEVFASEGTDVATAASIDVLDEDQDQGDDQKQHEFKELIHGLELEGDVFLGEARALSGEAHEGIKDLLQTAKKTSSARSLRL